MKRSAALRLPLLVCLLFSQLSVALADDDVTVTLQPAHASFSLGETIVVMLRVQNRGDRPIRVVRMPFGIHTADVEFRLIGANTGRQAPFANVLPPGPAEDADMRVIEPGATLSFRVNLKDEAWLKPQRIDTYTLSVSVRVDGTRRVKSDPVSIVVASPPALRNEKLVRHENASEKRSLAWRIGFGRDADSLEHLYVIEESTIDTVNGRFTRQQVLRLSEMVEGTRSLEIQSAKGSSSYGERDLHLLLTNPPGRQQYFVIPMHASRPVRASLFEDGVDRTMIINMDTIDVRPVK